MTGQEPPVQHQDEPEETPPNSELHAVDEFVSEQLDRPIEDWTDSDWDIAQSWSPAQRRRAAGLLFLHSALDQGRAPNRAAQEDRIQRVMHRLTEPAAASPPVETQPVRRVSHWRHWSARWSVVAAVVLFAVWLWPIGNGSNSAQAALDRALSTARQPRDRQYTVTAKLRTLAGGTRTQVSSLYLRGPQQFLLDHPALLRGRLRIGCDGQELWVVPAIGPVVVSADQGPLLQLVNEFQLSTPYMQVTSVLTRMGEAYTVTELPPEVLPNAKNAPADRTSQRLQGILKTSDSVHQELLFPHRIDLWLDRGTGEVQRLELAWSEEKGQASLGPAQISFELTGFEQQPANWFSHNAHHGPQRPVVKLRESRAAE